MNVGFIVGTILAIAILISGIIGLLISNHKKEKNKWALAAVIFGICALISAAINAGVLF